MSHSIFRRFPTIKVVVVLAVVVLVVGGGRWLVRPVETQSRAEEQLERDLIAFQRWDGESWVVALWDDIVIMDRLVIDVISIEWPPTPRWQWTGNFQSMPPTTAAASLGSVRINDEVVLWGQVNAPEIMTMEVQVGGTFAQYPVRAPGYIVRTGSDTLPDRVRWLDANGTGIQMDHP